VLRKLGRLPEGDAQIAAAHRLAVRQGLQATSPLVQLVVVEVSAQP
jgi:hypothetical protein